jgi:hypothetical protein
MRNFILFSLFIFISFQLQATTYYSTQNGDWTDPIWSTISHTETSGLVSLPCNFNGKDVVRMAHDITCSCTTLDLGDLSASGTTDIILDAGSTFTINGDLNLAGTHFTYILPSSIMIINGNLNMVGTSDIEVDGNLQVNGNVDMAGNSSVCGSGTASYTGTLTLSGAAVWCSSLPIELSSFNAEWDDREGVILYWVTESELNNDYFDVERSFDGDIFEMIDRIEGAGTTSIQQHYEYNDQDNLMNYDWVYYRIKQTDYDGSYSYSNVLAIEPQGSKGLRDVVLYPNPATEYVNVEFNADAEEGQVHVYNSVGQQISFKNYQGDAKQQLIFNTENWENGIYIVVIYAGEYQLQQRLMIQR